MAIHFERLFVSKAGLQWETQLRLNRNVNWQVKTFHETFMNIMSNFIPNVVKKCVPRDPPWINRDLRTLLKKKNRLDKNYKRHGYKENDRKGWKPLELSVPKLLRQPSYCI